MLASLQHPNIIKLRGISHGGAMGFADGPGGYFLIIDRLFETLDQRIRKWRHTGSKMQKSLSRMKSMKSVKSFKRSGSMLGSTDTETRLLDERLTIGEYNSASLSILYGDILISRVSYLYSSQVSRLQRECRICTITQLSFVT